MALLAIPTTVELKACFELCRLGNNIGFWVVWLPTAWSIAMACKAQADISITTSLLRAAVYVPLSFGVKSLIMTIDDLLDHEFDAMVVRTKGRAIPRGAISLGRAWTFFGLQVVFGVVLAYKILYRTALLISMSVWPLFIIYPTCKRWTSCGPIPLGLMFSVGIFMGWSDVSVDGVVPFNVLIPVYLAACFWTWSYETVYQYQDKRDDVKIGLKSAALLCGKYTIPICVSTAVGFILSFAYGGLVNGQGILFYVGIAAAGFVLIGGLLPLNVDHPAECNAFFRTTPLVGQIILLGCVGDVVVDRWRK
ncbi:UbiA prenyltransferase [Mycena filopes]|nr:UbiA prenyltransferase [Mycena filopes]